MEKSITFEGSYARVKTTAEGASLERLDGNQFVVEHVLFNPNSAEEAHEYAKVFGILRRRMLGLANHHQRLEAE